MYEILLHRAVLGLQNGDVKNKSSTWVSAERFWFIRVARKKTVEPNPEGAEDLGLQCWSMFN